MSTVRTWHGHYVSAYGIAVKHGFVGSEEDWLHSLYCEMRYNSETKTIEYKPRSEDEWLPFMSLAEIQEGAVADTLAEVQAALEAAGSEAQAAADYAAGAEQQAAAANASASAASLSAEAAAANVQSIADLEASARQYAADAEASASMAAKNAATINSLISSSTANASRAESAKTAAEAAAERAETAADSVSGIADSVGKVNGIAQLDANGKVPMSQLPAMDYDVAGAADGVQTNLNTHTADNAAHVSAAERAAWNGKADLDDSGKVPVSQLPALGLSEADVQAMIDEAIGGAMGGSY